MTEILPDTGLEAIEDLDFHPACEVFGYYFYPGLGSVQVTAPCGKPATHAFTCHEYNCEITEGYVCTPHLEYIKGDPCPTCGAPRASNIHPI